MGGQLDEPLASLMAVRCRVCLLIRFNVFLFNVW